MPIAATLQSKRLTLRKPQASDLASYVRFFASERSHFLRGPVSAAEAFDKLAAMIGHWEIRGFGRYVIEHEGHPIGHAGPLAIEDPETPELTWSLWQAEAEGHGYATEALQAVSQHLLDDQGWAALTILIQPDNLPSRRLAERLGAVATDAPAPDWYAGAMTYQLTAETLVR